MLLDKATFKIQNLEGGNNCQSSIMPINNKKQNIGIFVFWFKTNEGQGKEKMGRQCILVLVKQINYQSSSIVMVEKDEQTPMH